MLQRAHSSLALLSAGLFAFGSAAHVSVANESCAAHNPLLALPDHGACPNFIPDGPALHADTYEELVAFIGDPPASLYIAYGFVAAAFQNYLVEVEATPEPATVSAFNQGTADNAQGLYDDPQSGFGTPIADWSGTGDARLALIQDRALIYFWERCFYSVTIAPAPGGDATNARCQADEVLEKIQTLTRVEQSSWSALKRWRELQ